ncbi:ubiquitin-conjugating enzyme e2 [Bacillus phage vB_BanS_Nate]|uniref:Ubiquitin-conjugating enzyme e2 n=1 Tax=Bacillus phage vB_BanS_Nate TaxID=2894788 RepID=A0AAE8YU79_9CAUD|nr:ubiquitin-conjugating enzyme e2 [Bacillus phage vB_BanS_Nate]UGO50858.1 ubiquitin-conjugating enzyme e2 [Bacillus phage vB_BanS_Nate]
MTKLLGAKAIYNRLQKELNKRFTEDEQEIIGYYDDTENDNTYQWNCEYKGKKFQLVCNKKTGIVTYCG